MNKYIILLLGFVTSLASLQAQNIKISDMTSATDLSGAVYIPIVQGGANKKWSINSLPLPVSAAGTGITSYTSGDILYASGSTTLSKLAKGTGLQILQMNSGATAPQWYSPTVDPGTTAGDMLYLTAAGTPNTYSRIAAGSEGQVLQETSSVPTWTNNNGGWTVLRVAGSDATTTGQSLTDITGLISATLTNATKYEIEVVLDIATSAVVTGQKFGIATGGSGTASVVSTMVTGNTTSTTGISEPLLASATTTTTAYNTTSSGTGTIIIKGFVTTRGSGTATISIQHEKETSGTSTVKIGSMFKYRLAQ